MRRRTSTAVTSTSTSPRRARWRTPVRVLLLLTFVAVLAGGWSYRGARAQMNEGLMGLGGQMMAYAEAGHQDAPRDLVLNGQVLRFSSGTTPRSTREVLDFYEARCAEVDGALMEEMRTLGEAHPEVRAELPERPALREEHGLRGYVSCLDMGPDAVPLTDLVERIGRYGATGDVSHIGDLRFVFAEQMGEGAARSTHFVAMWTTGTFDVRRMFPNEGDVPGADVSGIARPPRSRRTLNGYERGVPNSMTVYETRASESDLIAHYRQTLTRGGFEILERAPSAGGAARDPRSPNVLVAEQGARMLTVVFHTSLETGHASAAVFDGQ